MKGDFTRDTFDPLKHFSRVLMQQGRVTLDADANEQTAILLRLLRKLARDIIGPYAGPIDGGGFQLAPHETEVFSIGRGCYYVDGILVENDTKSCTYLKQPDYPVPDDDPLRTAPSAGANVNPVFWIYLDVWERHITRIEDDSIREKALGGPDTCTRAKVVWQVKAQAVTTELNNIVSKALNEINASLNKLYTDRINLQKDFQNETAPEKLSGLFQQMLQSDDLLARRKQYHLLPVHQQLLKQLTPLSKALMVARVDPGVKTEDACVTPPDSKYRGAENQLYRVEIHRGGKVGDEAPPTFKWSRDNGSVATAWLGVSGNDLQVASVRGFAAGNWVELSDDNTELLGKPGVLVKLAKVAGDVLTVVAGTTLPPLSNFPVNPKVRRWDQVETENPNMVFSDDNAVKIQEAAADSTALWIDLEDGVQIQFEAGGEYRTGDYWLIPARVATGKVEWPEDAQLNPQPLPPRGIEHHYAVLGAVMGPKDKRTIKNERYEFWPLLSCVDETAAQPIHDVVNPIGEIAQPSHNLVRRVFGLALAGVESTPPAPAPKAKKRTGAATRKSTPS